MFFKAALISTTLLVSAVLADRRHTHHQLQSLKRSDEVSSIVMAGAYFKNTDYTYAGATFNAPTITGPDGAGIMISVTPSIGCENPPLAGIVVMKGAHGIEYKAIVSSSKGTAESSDIEAGDNLKFFVNGVTGHIRVENRTKKRSIYMPLDTSHFCEGQASIMVEEIPGGKNPFGHFGTLTFENVGVATRSESYGLSKAIHASDDHKEVTVSFDNDSTFTVHQK